jgi:hypothetical protein
VVATLEPHLLPARKDLEDQGALIGGAVSRPFKPAGRLRTGWHKLAVEVGPEGVRGFWDGETLGPLPAAPFVGATEKHLAWLRRQQVDSACAVELHPDFTPRGPLGLFVSHGTAAFRHVVLEPFPRTP